MSATGNPPQLQLSLGGHQTFKRSFTQFGLDVDDGEDSRSEGSSVNASSSSFSGTSSTSDGSGSGSSGSRGVSSGSSFSSQAAADVFGYNDGERGERNKRARSEGPEREAVNVSISAASSSSTESLDTTSILSAPTSSGSLLDSGTSQDSSGAHNSPRQATGNISGLDITTGFTLPVLDFGPSTPSVAEFVALRSGTSNARTAENPPGFANMLSPRSSSPAPPHGAEIDVAMQDDDDADEPFPSIELPHIGLQNLDSSTSSSFLDTARSDTLLDTVTERLRYAMERAHTFERMLAPLRSGAADESGGSAQQTHARPRLPPFDFESRRRRSSPAYSARTTNAVPFSPSILNRTEQYPPSVAGLESLTSLSSDSEEEEDDIIVDRELTVEPESDDSNQSFITRARPGSRSILHNLTDSDGEAGGFDLSTRALEDRVRAINSLTDRTLDDLTSFVSTSETDDDVRVPSLTAPPQLNPRLTTGGVNRMSTGGAPRIQLELDSPRLPLGSSGPLGGTYGPVPPRPVPRPGTSWYNLRDRGQGEEERSEVNMNRFRGWPWTDLLSPSSSEWYHVPGLGPLSNSTTQTRTNQEEAPLLHLRPHSPLPSLPLPFPSLSSPRRNEEPFDTENGRNRIRRMVETDMELDAQNRPAPDNRSLLLETSAAQGRLHSSGTTQNRATRYSPSRRPNLPTLRSAILGSWGNDGDHSDGLTDLLRSEELWRGDQPVREAARASVTDSSSGNSLRSRVARGDHLTTRPSLLDLGSHSQEHMMRIYRDLPASGRPDEEQIPFAPGHATGASRAATSTGNAQMAASRDQPQGLPTRHMDYEREIARRRQQQLLHSRIPPIPEEVRLRDTETATRLRELRDRHRLTLPPRSQLTSRQERPVQTQPRGSWGVLNSDSPDERFRSPAASALTALRSSRSTNGYVSSEVRSDDSSSNAPASSTEAAAFFASGPWYGSIRPSERASSAALRRRLRMLPDSDDDGVASNLRNGAWGDLDLGLDLSDIYGPGRDSPQSTSPSERSYPSPEDDLLQLLYSRRGLQDTDASSQGQASADPNDLASVSQLINNPELDDLPPLSESRVRTWNSISTQSPAHRGPVATAADVPRRSISLRNTSRPPSLPPLHFDRLSAISAGGSDDTGNRSLGNAESAAQRAAPWRRMTARTDGQTDSLTGNSPSRNALQTSSDLALHHAMVFQSIQARRAMRDSEWRSNAVPPPARTQGFQQAMDVLGADGLPGSLRQRFDGAFQRRVEQGRSNNSTRNDAHVRWGELADDNTTESRTTARSSPRPWLETSFRTRRRSASALFAPPPDNADNAPPNRNRGAGPAGGDPHAQGQGSQFDWFSMISSNRARARQRRLARYDDESSRSSFLRFGRSRAGLRNVGDFVRDEDFDSSYENLIAIAQTLGEVKPRSTPAHVINALPTGFYKDWQGPGSDTRCPICLDDYKDADELLKAEPCNHWCHRECFEQWLHTAQTCPVCRTKIKSSKRSATPPPVAGPSRLNRAESLEDIAGSSDDDYSFLSSSPNRAFFESIFADRQSRVL